MVPRRLVLEPDHRPHWRTRRRPRTRPRARRRAARWRRRDGPRPRAPCPRTPRGRSAAGWPGAGSRRGSRARATRTRGPTAVTAASIRGGRGCGRHARAPAARRTRASAQRPQRPDRREAVPGRLRQDDPGDREREADQTRDRRQQPGVRTRPRSSPTRARGHELERGPAGEHAAERERRRHGQSRDGREPRSRW